MIKKAITSVYATFLFEKQAPEGLPRFTLLENDCRGLVSLLLDAEEPLQRHRHGGVYGAGHGDLGDGEQEGDQVGEHLQDKTLTH